RAFLSAVDPVGEQSVWILEELPEGGYSVLQALVGDEGTIEEAQAMVVVRRGYDSLLRSFEEQRSYALAELPVPIAIGLVEDAYVRNPAAAPRDCAGWRKAQAASRRGRRPDPPPVPEEERALLIER